MIPSIGDISLTPWAIGSREARVAEKEESRDGDAIIGIKYTKVRGGSVLTKIPRWTQCGRLWVGMLLACILVASLALPVMAAEKSTIVLAYNIYGNDDREAIWQRLIEAFNAQNEHYTIEAIRAVGNDKLRTMIAGGQAPDVVDFDRYQVVEWAHQGLFQPLDPLLKGDINVAAEFLPGPANESIFQGVTYAIPTDTDIRGLIWNRRLLLEAGLNGVDGPDSWQDFNDYIHKLTQFDPEGNIITYGFVPWAGNWGAVGWLWHFGGKLFDNESLKPTLDHPNNLEAYRWLVDWTQRYGTLSTLQSQGYNRWSPGKFLEQRQAMMVAHNEMVTVATEIHGIEVGAGPLPSPSGRDNGTWSGGFALAIPTGAKNLEGALDLIKFLTSTEAQLIWWESLQLIPTRYEALRQINPGLISPEQAKLLSQVEVAHWRPPYTGEVFWPLLDQVDDKVLNAEQDPVTALQDAQRVAAARYAEIFGQ